MIPSASSTPRAPGPSWRQGQEELEKARIAPAAVGPLAEYADGYRRVPAGLGHPPDVVRKLREFDPLSNGIHREPARSG
jgi:hypothetical protein